MKNVTIVGCGSLGSHIATRLHTSGFNLKLIDDDVVEEKNLNYGTFNSNDVGKKKVSALEEKFNKTRVLAIPYNFQKCYSTIPKTDFILNCADRSLNLKLNNSLKCCISDKFLLLDGRKDKKEEVLVNGVYHLGITRYDIEMSAAFISELILQGQYLYNFMSKNTYVILNLDELHKIHLNKIAEIKSHKENYIYEKNEIFNYVMQLPELINSIIDSPFKTDLKFNYYFGDKHVSFVLKKENQKDFNRIADSMNNIFFSSFDEELIKDISFLVSNKINNNYAIIPAVGGA